MCVERRRDSAQRSNNIPIYGSAATRCNQERLRPTCAQHIMPTCAMQMKINKPGAQQPVNPSGARGDRRSTANGSDGGDTTGGGINADEDIIKDSLPNECGAADLCRCHHAVVVRDLLAAQACKRLLRGLKAKQRAVDARGANLHSEQLHDKWAAHFQDLFNALAAELVGNE